MSKERIEFLENRIEKNENCVHFLEATANVYYDPIPYKGLKGWNILLGSRDKVKKLIEDDLNEIHRLKNKPSNDG